MASRQLDEEAIFHIARKLDDPDDRQKYLAQVCMGDLGLRDRVEELLKVHDDEQDFLKSPPEPGPTVDQPPITERPGTTIGRYHLREQIGEGGMGVVFVAEQERPIRRKVALKVIKPGMDSKAVIARFDVERQALAMMDHPNIAKVLDAGTTESGRPYFVMELVRGVPITKYCDENKLPITERLELFTQVCQAIQHAHQKGIIHRDIKPTNVLVTLHDDKPVIKVIDFGVAKAVSQRLTEQTVYTGFAQAIGTPLYMSPEQAGASGLDIDTRTDIYSLGVLLYELLTGTTPFDKQQFEKAAYEEVRRIIREQEPAKPSTRISTLGATLQSVSAQRKLDPQRLCRFVRGDLDWIVMKSLEKDRQRRYETASSLAADVRRFLHDEPVLARRPSISYRIRKFVRRNSGLVAAVIAVVTILCIGVIGTSFGLVQSWRDQSRLAGALGKLRAIALDRAITDVLAGNREQAETAIQLAEDAEVSEPWLEVLRAEIDSYDGRFDEAVRRLTAVAESMPADDDARVAVLSSLALAHAAAGRDPKYIEYLEQSRKLPLRSPEDHLFYGKAECEWDKSLESLTAAMKTRPTPTTLFARARVKTHQSIDTADLDVIEEVLRDFEYVELFLGERPAVLAELANAHRAAYELTRGKDQTKAEQYLALLRADVERLRENPDHPFGSFIALNIYDCLDDFQSLSDFSQKVDYRDRINIEYPAAFIYGRFDDPTKSLSMFRNLRFDRNNPNALVSEAHFLAETPDGRSQLLPLFEHLKATHSDSPQVRYRLLCILALLGDARRLKVEAKELLRCHPPGLEYWGMEESVKYLAGEVDEQGLMVLAGPSRDTQCTARYACGLQMLANNDRKGARQQFDECVQTGVYNWLEYNWAKAFIKRMDQNPGWPKWIE